MYVYMYIYVYMYLYVCIHRKISQGKYIDSCSICCVQCVFSFIGAPASDRSPRHRGERFGGVSHAARGDGQLQAVPLLEGCQPTHTSILPRLPKPLYLNDHNVNPYMISRLFLNQGLLEAPGCCGRTIRVQFGL